MPDIPALTSVAYSLEDVQPECLDALELALVFYTDEKNQTHCQANALNKVMRW